MLSCHLNASGQDVPTFNGETPPLMPRAGAPPKLSSAPKAVRSREARKNAKQAKRCAYERFDATRVAKKAATAAEALVAMATADKMPGDGVRPERYRPAAAVAPARELVLEDRHRKAVQGAWWAPTRSSMTNSTGTENRPVFGVRFEDVLPMLRHLAPQLASRFAGNIASRRVEESRDLDADDACTARRTRTEMQAWDASRVARDKGGLNDDGSYRVGKQKQRRGAAVICTLNTWSSSGPHRDASCTILLVVHGQRTVYFAPSSGDDTAERDDTLTIAGGPPFLPASLDPTLHPSAEMKGVRWCSEPVTLECGDAMWIPRGWWHCVRSEADSVAVPIEVAPDVVSGVTPCVWRKVATVVRYQKGAPLKLRHSAPTWHSAAGVRDMWQKTLEPR
jgi:hypothetical protein